MKRSFGYKLIFMISMAVFGTIGLFVKNISVSSGELAPTLGKKKKHEKPFGE